MGPSAGVTVVTGCTGLVGNNVTRQLLARGERVRVLVRAEKETRPFHGLDVEVAAGDILDAQAVAAACAGAKAVIHCAGLVRIGWSHPEEFQATNVQGTVNVARASREAGARLVLVSTTDVFGACSPDAPTTEETAFSTAPAVPYVTSKRAAEGVVRELMGHGLDAVIVNPAFMLGPWDWKPSSGRLLLTIARGTALFAPRGTCSLCDARDVAAGIVAARSAGRSGERYILAGRTMSYLELFRLCAQVTGRRPPLCRAGPLMLKIGGWGGDAWGRMVGREMDVNSATVRLAWLTKNYSSAKAQCELGYRVRPAIETVRDAWQWFVEYGYA